MPVLPCILLAVVAAAPQAQQQSSPAASQPGKKLFEGHCAVCHGLDGGGGRGPSLRRARLSHAPNEAALRAVISDGIAPDMPDGWFLTEDEIADLAGYVRSLGALPPERLTGDVRHGAQVYAKHGCAGCHVLAGDGHAYGPELTGIGERRSASFIREVLLNPAAALGKGTGGWTIDTQSMPSFLLIEAVTAGGETIRGIRVNEDSFTIQIKDSADGFHSLRKEQLKALRKLRGNVPMPSFKGVLTETELRDLAAYLAAQEGQP